MTRTERTYYLVFGLYSLWAWFVAPVYPLFLRSRGLDALEVNLVLATYLLVVFAFEVPTGALADVLGRRFSFLLSCMLRTVAFGLYAVADGFLDCAIAEIVDGVGTTLASGALDAWAIDGMREEGDPGPFDRFFARAQMLVRAVMIVGGVACAYLASVDFATPWWVGSAGFAATGLVAALAMREPEVRSPPESRTNVYRTMRVGFASVGAAPVLMLVCALTAITFFALVPAHMLWQPHLAALSGEGIWLIGWLWVALNFAGLAGSVVLRLLDAFDRSRVLCVAALWRGGLLAFAAAATTYTPALAGWLLQEVSSGLTEPMLQAWMNERVSADRRATALSIRSMFGTLGGGLGLVAIGFVARDEGARAAWAVSAALVLVTAPAFLLLGRLAAHAVHAETTDVIAEPVPAKVVPPAVS
jgi:MFS family permease